MKRSEIFESFVKIAQEKGLISEATHAEHTEKDFHETNPRHDSLSIEQIGKLYGTKPKQPEGMEYKRNIIEDAHPDSLVISPSHDKLNGLIENNNERQNIMLHIVHKEPDGHLTQRKYARKQLLLSLVRVGNELDNRGHDELRKLADACLAQASSDGKKKLFKIAFWPIIAGIAATVGLLYLQQHKSFHSNGFSQDYQKTINEIDDLIGSSVSWYGTGQSYKPEFIQQMTKLKSDLGVMNAAFQKVSSFIQSVEKPRTKTEATQELARIGQDPKTQESAQAVEEFNKTVAEYAPEIFQVVSNFARQSYKNEVTTSKGALTEAVDWTEILHGGAGLVSDDFDDVRRALLTLWADIKDMYGALKQSANIQKSLEQELQQSESQISKLENPEPLESADKTKAKPDVGGLGAVEEESKGFFGGLGG